MRTWSLALEKGTVHKLESLFEPVARVKVRGELFAAGELCQHNGNFAVQLGEVEIAQEDSTKGMLMGSTVSVELFSFFTDSKELNHICQPGAILAGERSISQGAILTCGGKKLADAQLGRVDGKVGSSNFVSPSS